MTRLTHAQQSTEPEDRRQMARGLRLALITPGFASPGETDFAIPALTDTVCALAARHDVHVFTLRYPHGRHSYRIEGASVHAFGWGTAGGVRRLQVMQQALAAIRSEHGHKPFDLFHGLWADEPGFIAALAGWLLGRPSLVSIMGGELVGFPDIGYGGQLSRSNRLLTRQALGSATAVTVGSRFLGDIAAPLIAGDRLYTVPLGVDTNVFSPQGPGREQNPLAPRNPHRTQPDELTQTGAKRHLLHVASLSPVKDQASLLSALRIVAKRHPEVHLHIVGSGPLQPVLSAQADSLAITGHVTFHGEVPHHRLPAWYRAADLFVLSSRYESQSLVALEAAACGCHVVGTAVGVLPELLPPGRVVPPGDHIKLAGAIETAISDQEAGDQLRAAMRMKVVERFSLETTLLQFESLYQGQPAGAR